MEQGDWRLKAGRMKRDSSHTQAADGNELKKKENSKYFCSFFREYIQSSPFTWPILHIFAGSPLLIYLSRHHFRHSFLGRDVSAFSLNDNDLITTTLRPCRTWELMVEINTSSTYVLFSIAHSPTLPSSLYVFYLFLFFTTCLIPPGWGHAYACVCVCVC